MSQSYNDGTGVLVLKQITPVIRALFAVYAVDKQPTEKGTEIYIASITDDTNTDWPEVLEHLEELTASLGLDISDDAIDELRGHLCALAEHFGVADDPVIQAILDRDELEDAAELDDLFNLAIRFDDGHGLTAIKFESCWSDDRASVGAFGGNGEFYGRHIAINSGTGSPVDIGTVVDEALAAGDLYGATQRIFDKVNTILDGVRDEATRDQLRSRLSARLADA